MQSINDMTQCFSHSEAAQCGVTLSGGEEATSPVSALQLSLLLYCIWGLSSILAAPKGFYYPLPEHFLCSQLFLIFEIFFHSVIIFLSF